MIPRFGILRTSCLHLSLLRTQVEVVDYICDVCHSILFGFISLVCWIVLTNSTLSFGYLIFLLIQQLDLVLRHLQIWHFTVLVDNHLNLSLVWVLVVFRMSFLNSVYSNYVGSVFGKLLVIFLAFLNPRVDERFLLCKFSLFIDSWLHRLHIKFACRSGIDVAEDLALDCAVVLDRKGANCLVF